MIHVANYSPARFVGWKRCTVDGPLPMQAGYFAARSTSFVAGRRVGLDTHVVDLFLDLDAGQVESYDLSEACPGSENFRAGETPIIGIPTIAGVPMVVVSVQQDGAGMLIHLRCRVGPMLCVDLSTVYYPSTRSHCSAEIVVTASNPTVPDMVATIPTDFQLRIDGAYVVIAGQRIGDTDLLIAAGETIADGQARSFPVTIIWPERMTDADDAHAAAAVASMSICANGISKLWPTGNPRLPAGASGLDWSRAKWGDALASIHRWSNVNGVGPNKRSNDTGAQADQVFVGAECVGPTGIGAEQVRYLAALTQSRRPCHHLEADGSLLRLAEHPDLVFWDGRPHKVAVSRDQLGKPCDLKVSETKGYWGPDVEHWLIGNLSIAARITGSPALQWQLAAQARVYLLTYTIDPKLPYQSQPFAARSVGWEAIAAVLLWQNLEYRDLAEQVRNRWLRRLELVLIPKLAAKAADIWDPRKDDPRLGSGEWWMPWQQAVGAYGLEMAGTVFGREDARNLALRGARRVVEDGWVCEDAHWTTDYKRRVDGSEWLIDADWERFGMPLAVATVLLHDPSNWPCRDIWAQIEATEKGGGQWIPPEMTK